MCYHSEHPLIIILEANLKQNETKIFSRSGKYLFKTFNDNIML